MPANSAFPRRVKFIEDCLTVDTKIVVPAKAGIQVFLSIKLDSGGVSPIPRKFRHAKFSAATIASRSMA